MQDNVVSFMAAIVVSEECGLWFAAAGSSIVNYAVSVNGGLRSGSRRSMTLEQPMACELSCDDRGRELVRCEM